MTEVAGSARQPEICKRTASKIASCACCRQDARLHMRQAVADRQVRRPSLDGSWRRKSAEELAGMALKFQTAA